MMPQDPPQKNDIVIALSARGSDIRMARYIPVFPRYK